MPKSLQRPFLTYSSSSETEDEVIPTVRKKMKGDAQKMHTPVARSLSSIFYQQLHPSSTTITLPKQSTSTQGQLAYEEKDAQLDSPVTPRYTKGKIRGRLSTIPPSSITTTESVPTLTVPGPSTSHHSSTPRSHPRQRNLTPSKIIPLLFMEDGGSESSGSESDASDEVSLGNNSLSSSSDEEEGNENDGTSVNLREVFSFDWSEGSDFVPDQHDFRPDRSGTARDWPCNDEARESAFFRAFIDEENIDPSKKPKLREFVYNVAYQLLEDFGEPTTNLKGRRPNPMPDRIIDAYSRHYPVNTEIVNGKRKPRDCYVCKHTTRRQKKRTRVVIICNECNIGLCIGDCFRDYHTLKNF
ncbi:hypothetical protein Pmani_013120 [Petrolisthes manimaculis]|uniref:PiggyBac transposable element-derived protein 4 C-terminal zinc-finger domain-containing protein n=1 Tax=Petrolisthes manimaculis TaxID=1843537 RepID=A0AAE1PX71_9EUCA|nr:hypothetical protein Pmani_013120 [Petrolisthes manimaculis]